MYYLKILFICALTGAMFGCSTLAGKLNDTGVVIARRAQIRSSTAVVAADLVEVSRGDVLDIMDSEMVENEKWLFVRAHDIENTEGWIEARNVMPQDLLDRSVQVAAEDKDIPAQATGQLRASTNLRSSADRSGADNILLKLESGAHFEIVGWKRVPKPKASETTESDDTPKAGAAATQGSNKKKSDSDAAKEAEELNELWYKVRLPKAISPAPAGWVYAKQVELTVPSDIIFYRTGREFVAWQRLDDAGDAGQTAPKDKDAAKESQPGSWVILEKSSSDEPSTLDEPDFDRIFVLGYDKSRQEHYTAYRSPDLHGRLPLRVENNNGEKFFIVKAEDNGQLSDIRFKVYRDDRGNLKVDAQSAFPKSSKKK